MCLSCGPTITTFVGTGAHLNYVLNSQVPYDYYTLPFCKPAHGVQTSAENLGEFLTGDRIDNSPYMLYMRDDTTCNILCQQVYGKKDVEVIEAAIDENYHHNWVRGSSCLG